MSRPRSEPAREPRPDPVAGAADRAQPAPCETPRAARAGAWLAASIGLALVAAVAIDTRIVGLYHDDGVYIAVAKAFAEFGEYRISSVPGTPFQTKYPPLYSLLLSIVWRIAPEFPRNVVWLKALNLACVALALYGVSRLAARTLPGFAASSALVAMLVLATSPGVALFAADYATSDALFMTLVVWATCLSLRRDEEAPGHELLIAALIAAAILTRSIGVALGAALAIDRALRRRWRAAALYGTTTVATFFGWVAWAAGHRASTGNPLLVYYQSYETTALGYLLREPILAWNIVLGNLRIIAEWGGLVAGPALLGAGAVYLVVALWGAYELWRAGHTVVVVVAATYLAAVLVYPFSPLRYLLPMLPLSYVAVLATTRRLKSRAIATALTVALATPLLVGNVLWLRDALAPGARHVRGWSGVDLGYDWKGFEESFRWIRTNTAPDARIASIFDPVYFLYTGRQGIRPWLHHPETYFYPYGAAKPYVGTPIEVASALRDLRVQYVVLDPPTGYAEGEAADQLLKSLVRIPELRASLAFTSSDGQHRIYRLSGIPAPDMSASTDSSQPRPSGDVARSIAGTTGMER